MVFLVDAVHGVCTLWCMSDAPNAWADAMRRAGGADALAAQIGIARRTLFVWKSQGVPADRLAAVSAATGIPAADLRPDLAAAFASDPAQ